KRVERMKDEFVATVSHELRTPLTSIAGALSLLAHGISDRLPSQLSRLMDIAQANCQRLVRLVNDILDVGRIESGNMSFDFQPVDGKLLIRQAIEVNRTFTDKFNVKLVLDPSADEATIWTDAHRLTQVIVNLLSNAAKFSPPDQEVVVSIETRGKVVR